MMKLLSSPLSPYGRKVKMTLQIKGLEDKVEIVAADTNPGDNVEINSANPLGKIPALVVDGKTAIFDSHVICEYLDSLAPSPVLFPKSGPERWKTLVLGSLADGILDAALLLVYEKRFRPEDKWHARLAAAPAGQDRPRARSAREEPADVGRKPRLRPPDARLRARLSRFPARGQMARRATRSWWRGSTSSRKPCRPSRRRGRRSDPRDAAMLRATEVVPAGEWKGTPADVVRLDYDRRTRRRIALTGAGGLGFLLDLAKAPVLRAGDGIKLEDGRIVAVEAASERLLEIACRDTRLLARIAWHLGNRHLATEIAARVIHIRDDHVIADMIRGLGAASALSCNAPSTPKAVPTARVPCRGTVSGHHHHGHDGDHHH